MPGRGAAVAPPGASGCSGRWDKTLPGELEQLLGAPQPFWGTGNVTHHLRDRVGVQALGQCEGAKLRADTAEPWEWFSKGTAGEG